MKRIGERVEEISLKDESPMMGYVSPPLVWILSIEKLVKVAY